MYAFEEAPTLRKKGRGGDGVLVGRLVGPGEGTAPVAQQNQQEVHQPHGVQHHPLLTGQRALQRMEERTADQPLKKHQQAYTNE